MIGDAEYDAAFRARMKAIRAAMEVDQAAVEAWHASIVRRQAEALIELVDQRIQGAHLVRKPSGLRRIAHAFGNLIQIIHRRRPSAFQEVQHRDLQPLRDASLDLQLAASIFELAQASFHQVVHPNPSVISNHSNANPAAPGDASSK